MRGTRYGLFAILSSWFFYFDPWAWARVLVAISAELDQCLYIMSLPVADFFLHVFAR